MINAFAKVAGAPRLTEALPKAALPLALKTPGVRERVLPSLGIPAEVVDYIDFTARFDARETEAALAGTDISVPPLESYAETLWEYWDRELATA